MAVAAVPMLLGDVEVLVEVVQVAGTEPTSRLDKARDQALGAFDRAKATIVGMATVTLEVADQLAATAAAPREVEVEFGLKFSAQGNVIVAGGSGEAALTVRLKYGGPVVSSAPAAVTHADAPSVEGG